MSEDQDLMDEHRRLIRARLTRSGITQVEIAGMIGVSPAFLNLMLSGEQNLPPHRFGQILQAIATLAASTPARTAD